MNKILVLLVLLSGNCFSASSWKNSWENYGFYYSETLDCFINEKTNICEEGRLAELLKKEGKKSNHEETFVEVNQQDNDIVLITNKNKNSTYGYVFCIYVTDYNTGWVNTYENYLSAKKENSVDTKNYEGFLNIATEINDFSELKKHIRKPKEKEPWKYTEIDYKDGTEESFKNNDIECYGYPDYCTIDCSGQKQIMLLIRNMWNKEDNLAMAPRMVKVWTHPQIHNKAILSFNRDAHEDFYDWAVKKNGKWNIVEDAWPDNYLNKMGQQKRIVNCKKWGINPDWDFGDMNVTEREPNSYVDIEDVTKTSETVSIIPADFTEKERQAYILGKHDEHCYIICMMLADDKKWLNDYRQNHKSSGNSSLDNEIKKTENEVFGIGEDYYISLVKQAEQGAKDNDCDCLKFEVKNENKKESH